MKNISRSLRALGLDSWFEEKVGGAVVNEGEPARVVAVHRDSYTISNGENAVMAELVGKLLYTAASPMDYPAVGDWVTAHFYDDNTFALIHTVLPRKSLLKRKTAGKNVEFQIIAANIDTAFIIQSLDDNFNLNRLERYLVMVNEGGIEPVVLLSKSDLIPSAQVESNIGEIHDIMPQLSVLAFTNEDESSLSVVWECLNPGLTYCLLGSSGVGKTTLLNNLTGAHLFKTEKVREKDSKGKHATTYRQLVKLKQGAMVVDTPGLRELGNFSVERGIEETFDEIARLSERCRFSDCTHMNEKGCAVLDALAEGRLPEKRYQNYIKMTRESIYNDMSYLEKKQKDKAFGKLVKNVMKHKKNRR